MRLRIIATSVVTAALLTTGAVAASAETVASADAAGDCQFGEHLLHVWLRLPADLRGDLSSLRGLDPADRKDAAQGIREGALGGEYGPRVQAGAERLRSHRVDVISQLPAELKSDLVELRHAAQADRPELAKEIAQTALDGGYGAKTQATAERIQSSDAWQNCVAG
jgi:hypothetical protein